MAINDLAVERKKQAQKLRGAISDFCIRHKVHMIVGAHAWEQWGSMPGDPDRIMPLRRHNAAYCFGPGGELIGRYDKMHLVPFGEYMPGVDVVPLLKSVLMALTPYREEYTLKPGSRTTVFELTQGDDAQKWGVVSPICFEDLITDVPKKMVWSGDRKADLMVNLTNDGWYAGTAEGPQHEQMARFRCVENRVPMVRSVNTGISCFIDSCGRVVGRVEVDGEYQSVQGTAAVLVRTDGRTTLFGRIGEAPAIVCGMITLGLVLCGVLPMVRRRPQQP
jgi:apolipoprotein N-acyltransferase